MEKKAAGGGGGCGSVLMHKYELGRVLGQGTFAKVYHARSLASGESVAIKVIDKAKVLRVGMIDQIKREISVMRLVRHPNVVHLHEVMATKSKIYFVMEYVRGGELFSKVAKGRLKEDDARRYFQQLLAAIDFCHSRGVYHRDLKPENLLLDENGNLKVSDFGLSALGESRRQDGLLHTTCGTPAYVAPEVINKKGYDGKKADIWSCGVVLFVLLAGYLPFRDSNLMEMYRKICRGDFRSPNWFTADVRRLLSRVLDPNPNTRITVAEIMETSWFKQCLTRPPDATTHAHEEQCSTTSTAALRDIHAAFATSEEEQATSSPSTAMRPTCMNAFDIISLSAGFDLSGLFERGPRGRSDQARFATRTPAGEIASRLEEIAGGGERFRVRREDGGVVKLEGRREGRKGQLAIDAEIFEVTPSLYMVEVKKAAGDSMEYQTFCNQELRPSLKDIVWAWQGQGADQPQPEHAAAAQPQG